MTHTIRMQLWANISRILFQLPDSQSYYNVALPLRIPTFILLTHIEILDDFQPLLSLFKRLGFFFVIQQEVDQAGKPI